MMYELEQCLAEISGLSRVSLQPAAGAQGEMTGMMMIRAYHKAMGNPRKRCSFLILPMGQIQQAQSSQAMRW